ncbi:MAG: radical SAM protein [Vicinamibacterales bacterium]
MTAPITRALTRLVNLPRRILWGNWLTHIVITRRCNLSCGYCNEFDKKSEPVPYEVVCEVIDKVASFGTFSLELTGGEALLHPRLIDILDYARRVGIPRRRVITNGFLLTPDLIRSLNTVGLYQLSISVDGVNANEKTEKVLAQLEKRLTWLRTHAAFQVSLGTVLGSTDPVEVKRVLDCSRANGFKTHFNILHDDGGQALLSSEELEHYRQVVTEVHGLHYNFQGDYRWRLVNGLDASFRCRAGSRYLYVDEFQRVPWCSQTRFDVRSKSIFDYTWNDMRLQFHTPKPCHKTCTVGCARRVSRMDEWRSQFHV